MRRAALVLWLAAACGPGASGGRDAGDEPDAAPGDCNPSHDTDADGISNGREGCQSVPPRDTDGDGTPDWLDTDSDNDGVDDIWEDRNGDGMIGNCTTSCVDVSMCPPGYACSLPIDGASIGYCVHPECLDGETNPHAVDTDGDGQTDDVEGTWVCRPMEEDNPYGLKPIKYVDSADVITDSAPNWKIAIEIVAVDGPVMLSSPQTFDSAYVMDLPDPSAEVAGFLVSRSPQPGETDAPSAAQEGQLAVASTATSSVLRASGTRNTSLDGFDTVLATTMIVTTASTDATALRNQVMAALLERSPSDLTIPPVGWTGPVGTQFAVQFQTVYRADPGQVLYMGAVTMLSDFDDAALATGFHSDDLANGTGLTVSQNGEAIECEQWLVAQVPKADIVWVVDESGSMDDDRANVAMNATAFFNKAVLAGLDFRMGVTDMHLGRNGRFASRQPGSSTGDRWLLPAELTVFQNNINDPSGPDPADGGSEHGLSQMRDAVQLHLPRSDVDQARLRPDAKLVIIVVTDEHPDEIEDAGIIPDGNSIATPAQKAEIAMLVQPYRQLLDDNDGIVHLIGVPETNPNCSGGGGEISYGYLDLINGLGGQFGSICQPDLGPTLDAIIDDIAGSASPIQLEFVPISATIAVSRDNLPVSRSRSMGWDYRASSNTIVFNNMPFDPLSPSEVVVSYRRWAEQVPIE